MHGMSGIGIFAHHRKHMIDIPTEAESLAEGREETQTRPAQPEISFTARPSSIQIEKQSERKKLVSGHVSIAQPSIPRRFSAPENLLF